MTLRQLADELQARAARVDLTELTEAMYGICPTRPSTPGAAYEHIVDDTIEMVCGPTPRRARERGDDRPLPAPGIPVIMPGERFPPPTAHSCGTSRQARRWTHRFPRFETGDPWHPGPGRPRLPDPVCPPLDSVVGRAGRML